MTAQTNHPSYPYTDGDVTVLGPEIFASLDGEVISWKGENYTRQSAPTAMADPKPRPKPPFLARALYAAANWIAARA
ncbi:hypothetical protein ACLIYP_05500 [Streptomyces nanhaiensis]|uniref:hypothetical protein n=1 Tax=Streptomyces nanhaiensis TaxID=679319 RepID=UPI00399C79F4